MATSNTSAPAKTPGSRATRSAVATAVVAGTKVWQVTSPNGRVLGASAKRSTTSLDDRARRCKRARVIGRGPVRSGRPGRVGGREVGAEVAAPRLLTRAGRSRVTRPGDEEQVASSAALASVTSGDRQPRSVASASREVRRRCARSPTDIPHQLLQVGPVVRLRVRDRRRGRPTTGVCQSAANVDADGACRSVERLGDPAAVDQHPRAASWRPAGWRRAGRCRRPRRRRTDRAPRCDPRRRSGPRPSSSARPG